MCRMVDRLYGTFYSIAEANFICISKYIYNFATTKMPYQR